jgi:hypothetical protein
MHGYSSRPAALEWLFIMVVYVQVQSRKLFKLVHETVAIPFNVIGRYFSFICPIAAYIIVSDIGSLVSDLAWDWWGDAAKRGRE